MLVHEITTYSLGDREMTVLLACILGIVMGIVLGLLGAGGSILAVPIFVYVLGVEPKAAIAMSLAVVGATAAIGTVIHWRAGHVRVRVAVVFAPAAMIGTYLGARSAVWFTGDAQLLLFAGVMILAAYFMVRTDGTQVLPGIRDPALELRAAAMRAAWLLLAAEALGVGLLTGLVGVGGGFLIVPALVLLAGVSMRDAVGTSLLVIALKSAAGFFGYLDQVEIDWAVMGSFTAAAAAGIFMGSSFGGLFSTVALRKAFALFLVFMAGLILYMEGLG